ncbi:MAG: NAD-dependent protein deacetylase, SIR2 family [Clostridia bacterium]|nr:NAD-dependent protein deacetylase, SIR2 family [Lachnospiraceae bacterium]NCB99707.1 NAD-dependent protein deacetylase, SIR2 family [Clostridia bacterium]NCD01720.1 NAD-dependent protein deacetylase, SIR2 family [Clostridia bacterium]
MTEYLSQLKKLAAYISEADAIVVGGGSGLSSAAGYNHYHWGRYMTECLKQFKDYYGFASPFAGFYHCYSTPEQQWAYYCSYIRAMWEAPTGQPYLDLKECLKGKDCFILTTNVDMQFNRVFEEKQICSYQGNMGFLQCSQPCTDEIYQNRNLVEDMSRNLKGTVLPMDMVPRCEHCGRIMVPWVRDDTFLEGTAWEESVHRYENFLKKYMVGEPVKKVVLLELGVGEMTPGIIKLPFWDMAEKNKNVFYACMNRKKSSVPEHLKERGIYIAEDLARSLHDLKDACCSLR